MIRSLFPAVLFSLLLLPQLGCEEEQPCDKYADYVCTCHPNDPELDCDGLRGLSGADTEVQDQCAIDLSSLRAEDDQAEEVCDVS